MSTEWSPKNSLLECEEFICESGIYLPTFPNGHILSKICSCCCGSLYLSRTSLLGAFNYPTIDKPLKYGPTSTTLALGMIGSSIGLPIGIFSVVVGIFSFLLMVCHPGALNYRWPLSHCEEHGRIVMMMDLKFFPQYFFYMVVVFHP